MVLFCLFTVTTHGRYMFYSTYITSPVLSVSSVGIHPVRDRWEIPSFFPFGPPTLYRISYNINHSPTFTKESFSLRSPTDFLHSSNMTVSPPRLLLHRPSFVNFSTFLQTKYHLFDSGVLDPFTDRSSPVPKIRSP